MKKLSLVAIAAFVTTIASAQIQFGVKAGLNLTTMHLSPSSSGSSLSIKPDFNAGGLVSIPLAKSLSLQPEVMYSGQGSKIKSGTETGNYNFGYVNVPVLVKYTHASGFFAELGPQVGFNVSAKVKASSQSQDVKDEIKSTDFSGVVGLGFLSSMNLGIDARYNLGFVNIIKESSDTKLKNNVIQVSVFYLFGARKK